MSSLLQSLYFLIFCVAVSFLIVWKTDSFPKKMKSAHILTAADSLQMANDSLLATVTPVMGYRFVIQGDFDGDGSAETLYERYTDSLYFDEAPKYYDSKDTTDVYNTAISLNFYYQRESFLEWRQRNLKLPGGHLGFHYVENCGDVNNDGKDEVLVLCQWADFSNINHVQIFTLNDGKWKEIYTAPVWEWQFPPTPSVSMVPGMFGSFQVGFTNSKANDALLEKQLKAFHFFTRYNDHSVEFSGMNDIIEWSNEELDSEYNEIGEIEFIEKYFTRAVINDSVYMRRKDNPSIYYKVHEILISETETALIFPLDDPAEMVTTRIFLNHPKSPFKNRRQVTQKCP